MKKIIILSIIVLSFPVFSYAQQYNHTNKEGVQFFEGTWDEALQKAKDEDKPIFLDVYASWCGPCKVLKSSTFPNVEAGNYFNQNFINVTLDGEKGDGRRVARDFNVHAYPSLFIVSSSGDPVVYYAGYLKPEQLIQLGKAGLEQLK